MASPAFLAWRILAIGGVGNGEVYTSAGIGGELAMASVGRAISGLEVTRAVVRTGKCVTSVISGGGPGRRRDAGYMMMLSLILTRTRPDDLSFSHDGVCGSATGGGDLASGLDLWAGVSFHVEMRGFVGVAFGRLPVRTTSMN